MATTEWYPPFLLGPTCDSPTCACPDGYTGRSEWISAQGVLCQINTNAVRGLWAVNMIVWAFVLLSALPVLLEVYQKYRNKDLKALPTPVWALMVLFLLNMPTIYILAFVKIFDENARIPFTLNAAIPWFLARAFFYLATYIHQPALLRHMLLAGNATPTVVNRQTRRDRTVIVVQVLTGFLAVPVYVEGDANVVVGRACFAVMLAIQLMCFVSMLISTMNIDRMVTDVLDKSYADSKSEGVLKLKAKLHATQSAARNGFIFQICFFIIWLGAPPLWVVHDYLLPVAWLSMPVITRSIVKSIDLRKKDPSHGTQKSESRKVVTEKGATRPGTNHHTSEHLLAPVSTTVND